jgi:hypothetical protein
MDSDYLSTLLPLMQDDGIAGGARRTINAAGKIIDRDRPFRHGVCVINRQAWNLLGGYRPWRMIADLDLIMRARALEIPINGCDKVIYSRREHPDSITKSKVSGKRTPARREQKVVMRKHLAAEEYFVPITTVPLIWRSP